MRSIALTVLFRHFSRQEHLLHLSAILLQLSCLSFSLSISSVCTKCTDSCCLFHRALFFFSHLLLNPDSGPNVAKPSSLSQRLATA